MFQSRLPSLRHASTFRRSLLIVAGLALLILATGCATKPGSGPVPPGSCPDGWRPVTPPLNPALICLPDTIVIPDSTQVPPGGCPDGWRPVTPPVNPVLGCLPDNFTIPQ